MAQALLLPLLEQGDPAATDVVAVVGQQTSADRLAHSMPTGLTIVPSTDARAAAAWAAPVQLLAIKPYQLDQVASMAPPVQGNEPSLLISVLAGVTLERLQRAFPGRVCVRAVASRPPSFTLFVNDPKLFGDTYRRYVERQIREGLGFEGTPLKLFWRGKQQRDAERDLARQQSRSS